MRHNESPSELARRLAAGCNVRTKHGFCFKAHLGELPKRYAYAAHRSGTLTQWFTSPDEAVDAMLKDAETINR